MTQPFAVFVMDRFTTLYRRRTLPLLGTVHPQWQAQTADCRDNELEHVRRVFAIRHDRNHESGARPLSKNLELKTEMTAGVIEEARVDLSIICDAMQLGGREERLLAELAYLDRVVRLANLAGALPSADASAGRLIRDQLLVSGVDLAKVRSVDDIADVLADLLNVIEAVDALPDDDAYRQAVARIAAGLEHRDSNAHFAGRGTGGPRRSRS
jgi:hypothetical protein